MKYRVVFLMIVFMFSNLLLFPVLGQEGFDEEAAIDPLAGYSRIYPGAGDQQIAVATNVSAFFKEIELGIVCVGTEVKVLVELNRTDDPEGFGFSDGAEILFGYEHSYWEDPDIGSPEFDDFYIISHFNPFLIFDLKWRAASDLRSNLKITITPWGEIEDPLDTGYYIPSYVSIELRVFMKSGTGYTVQGIILPTPGFLFPAVFVIAFVIAAVHIRKK